MVWCVTLVSNITVFAGSIYTELRTVNQELGLLVVLQNEKQNKGKQTTTTNPTNIHTWAIMDA